MTRTENSLFNHPNISSFNSTWSSTLATNTAPHHMDAVWCSKQPFGQRIAHGTLIFSVGVGMTAAAINSRAMSYGYDRLRFIRPVFLNDTIRARVSIREKREDPKRKGHGIVVEALEVMNQRGETVLVADHLLLVERRQPIPDGQEQGLIALDIPGSGM